jgi:pantoate--beta-alanine ligase
MKVVTKINDLKREITDEKQQMKKIGFVPTMGYLHEGHKKLLEHARKDNDIVVLSIFVNPLQFGPNEDLESYPRDIKRDETVAKEAGVDYLFYPTVHEMYPNEVTVKAVVQRRTDVLCGKQRPGHFDGVATVLTKFFNIVTPDKVYFGMKDAQQAAIVDGVISDFNFPIELIKVETVREKDGLAKSSRNVYLLEEERNEAKELYRSLQLAKEAIQSGEKNPDIIRSMVTKHLSQSTSGEIDYVEIYQYPELTPLKELNGTIIIAIAVKFKKARLIDNITWTIE